MPETRKRTQEEKEAVTNALRVHMDEILMWSQMKMVFRLLTDSPTIDKEKLAYANEGVDDIMNNILSEIVPKAQKRAKTMIEMTIEDYPPAILRDPLLKIFRESDCVYHITSPDAEEKQHSLGDLLVMAATSPPRPLKPEDTSFTLVGLSLYDGKNWGILDSNPVTNYTIEALVPGAVEVPTVAHGVYRVWCFQCRNLFTFEMNEGDLVEKIVCNKCNNVIIERRKKWKAENESEVIYDI